MSRAAVFLDRDGVLVIPRFGEGRSFAPTTLVDYRFYPNAGANLDRLKEAGYTLVVVTNQPDVGRGIIDEAVLQEMHRRLRERMPVDDIQVCRHVNEDACSCRKPKPGMLLEAAEKLGITLDRSFMVGDRKSDIEAGNAAGCSTVFIDLKYKSEENPEDADWTVQSLDEAVDRILTSTDKRRARNHEF
ncbi:MAG: HAD family hydrolase [Pseudomonadota bacterium]